MRAASARSPIPLAQGLLTGHAAGIPADSRAGKPGRPCRRADGDAAQLGALGTIAAGRGQSLTQLALAWVLRDAGMTSAIVGASRLSQLEECVAALGAQGFGADELALVERALS